MKSTTPSAPPSLDAREIREQVSKRLEKYRDLNELEQFAMFMGMAQFLEAGLRNRLSTRYGYVYEKLEKLTLGQIKNELRSCGIRADFITLLESVIGYRNHIAHEYLANDATLKAILDGHSGRLERKQLEKGIYELEQIMSLHDWCEEHNAWT